MTDRHADRTTAPLAIFLWVVVTVALGYGIIQTAGDTVALFTG